MFSFNSNLLFCISIQNIWKETRTNATYLCLTLSFALYVVGIDVEFDQLILFGLVELLSTALYNLYVIKTQKITELLTYTICGF